MRRLGIARAALPCLLAVCLAHGFGCLDPVPDAAPGAPDYQGVGWVAVPFGSVNVLGGNLAIERRDLDFDTPLGTVVLGGVWNSADRRWRASFELHYDGTTFVDASGSRHAVAGVAFGQAIPGTVWVRLGARTLRTKGGLVYEFDASGELAVVRWSSSAYPRLEYRRTVAAGGSRVSELRQLTEAGAGTQLARFAYDASDRLTSIEDRSGRRASFSWDATGRLAVARSAFDVERGLPGFRYAYAEGQLVAATSSDGVRAEYAYGPRGRLATARARGAGDPTFRFAYAPLGASFRTTATDPLGHATDFDWDRERRLLARTDAGGARTVWTWSGLRPASEVTPAGVATRWEYAGDDLARELQPSGNVVSFTWEVGGESRSAPERRALRRAADRLGLIEEREYDPWGRLLRVANGAGESWTYAWGAGNELAAVVDPAGVETRYRDYGAHGHPRRVERGADVETRSYDVVGNLHSGSGSAGLPGSGDTGVVSRSFDAGRNPSTFVLAGVDPEASISRAALAIEYRSDGQPLRIRRPEGGDSEFVYDALGRATERRDFTAGVWRSTRFSRDPLGRIVETELPNGMRTRVEYDESGRQRSVFHLRGGALESIVAATFESGRLATLLDSAHGFAPESYEYDSAGRVAAVRYPGGERLELGYDLRSRVVLERYLVASGAELRRLRFGYDLADREIALRDGSTPLRTLGYARGRLQEERFGNGLVRRYAYGAKDGLLSVVTAHDAAGVLVERSTLEQSVGFGIEWHAATQSLGALAVTSHEHFMLGPIQEDAPGPRLMAFATDAAGADLQLHAYDALGNLLRIGTAEAPESRFQFDAQRTRLLRVRRASGAVAHEYAYDEAGFVVTRDGEAIAWDGGGRPVSVGGRAGFRWDTLGRPVSTSLDGVTERRLFGGRVRATAGGFPVAIELGALELHLLGSHRFRHLDFRGNVKLVSDSQGRIVSHVRYGPYGADRVDGVPDPQAGFAQGRSVGEDLLLLGARLYDPGAARFLAPDPVFQIVNQYAYAGGNPVWYWDPNGRSATSSAAFALGVGVVGTGLGVAVVFVGGGTGIVTLVAGVTVIAMSEAFMVGAVAPYTHLGASAAGVGGAWAAIAKNVPAAAPLAGIFTGFSMGQQFGSRAGINLGPRAQPSPCSCLRPQPPSSGPGTQDKVIELSIAPGAPAAPPSGCSPTALSEPPLPQLHRRLGLLLALQAVLLAAFAWKRRGT